jgi:hypothetical protein
MPPFLSAPRPAMRLAGSACRRALPTHTPYPRRAFSASPARPDSNQPAPGQPRTKKDLTPEPPSRWITDLRARIGKCLAFGCNTQQISQAADVLRAIATEWKELLAGSEGFLTGGRRGLDGRQIAWGEMDSFVGSLSLMCPNCELGCWLTWCSNTSITSTTTATPSRRG